MPSLRTWLIEHAKSEQLARSQEISSELPLSTASQMPWNLHRELVKDRFRVGAREVFDQVKILIGSSEMSLVREIRRAHNQRIAFPMTHRVTQPLAYRLWQMWSPVQRDDPHFVNHLE